MPDEPVEVPVPLLAAPVPPVLLCVPYDVPPALPVPAAPLSVVPDDPAVPEPPIPDVPPVADELPIPDVPPVPPAPAPVEPPVPDVVLPAVSPVTSGPEVDPPGDDEVVPEPELVLVPALSCRPHAETDNASATPAAIQSCFMRSAPFDVEDNVRLPSGNRTHP
jgi:hypothetical protein